VKTSDVASRHATVKSDNGPRVTRWFVALRSPPSARTDQFLTSLGQR
jgi:hypothetical protein